MSWRQHLNVLSYVFRLGFRQTWEQKVTFVGSYIVYATIMMVYSYAIKMIPLADLEPLGLSQTDLIWYLATTEFVLFSCNFWGFKEIQEEIKNESIYVNLLRPYSDVMVRVGFWSGGSALRLIVMLPIYLLLPTVIGGPPSFTPSHVLGFMLSIPLPVMMMAAGAYFVGTTCLWVIQSEPAFWIWQKLIFLFGAMIWPLAFYPDILQTIIWATPFPGFLAYPANWLFNEPLTSYLLPFLHQVFWCAVLMTLAARFDNVILRRIQKGGN